MTSLINALPTLALAYILLCTIIRHGVMNNGTINTDTCNEPDSVVTNNKTSIKFCTIVNIIHNIRILQCHDNHYYYA